MYISFRAAAVALTLLGSAAPAAAHHAFSLEYDANKPVKFEGIVTKVEWTNPHARVYVDAADASGKKVTWNIELASLSALVRNGWTRNSVKPGEKVSVEGFEGRGTNTYRTTATVIRTASGGELFSGSAGEDGRPAAAGAPAR
ncbi:MAG: hypothetical protein FJW14_04510 [Acidimicrobiia bacterium]|nr:hypothetical protein [Acidimicrobiia bacterium]